MFCITFNHHVLFQLVRVLYSCTSCRLHFLVQPGPNILIKELPSLLILIIVIIGDHGFKCLDVGVVVFLKNKIEFYVHALVGYIHVFCFHNS